MIAFLESLSDLSHLILIFCAFVFYRKLKKTKQERKRTPFEIVLMILILFGIFSWAVSFALLQTQ